MIPPTHNNPSYTSPETTVPRRSFENVQSSQFGADADESSRHGSATTSSEPKSSEANGSQQPSPPNSALLSPNSVTSGKRKKQRKSGSSMTQRDTFMPDIMFLGVPFQGESVEDSASSSDESDDDAPASPVKAPSVTKAPAPSSDSADMDLYGVSDEELAAKKSAQKQLASKAATEGGNIASEKHASTPNHADRAHPDPPVDREMPPNATPAPANANMEPASPVAGMYLGNSELERLQQTIRSQRARSVPTPGGMPVLKSSMEPRLLPVREPEHPASPRRLTEPSPATSRAHSRTPSEAQVSPPLPDHSKQLDLLDARLRNRSRSPSGAQEPFPPVGDSAQSKPQPAVPQTLRPSSPQVEERLVTGVAASTIDPTAKAAPTEEQSADSISQSELETFSPKINLPFLDSESSAFNVDFSGSRARPMAADSPATSETEVDVSRALGHGAQTPLDPPRQTSVKDAVPPPLALRRTPPPVPMITPPPDAPPPAPPGRAAPPPPVENLPPLPPSPETTMKPVPSTSTRFEPAPTGSKLELPPQPLSAPAVPPRPMSTGPVPSGSFAEPWQSERSLSARRHTKSSSLSHVQPPFTAAEASRIASESTQSANVPLVQDAASAPQRPPPAPPSASPMSGLHRNMFAPPRRPPIPHVPPPTESFQTTATKNPIEAVPALPTRPPPVPSPAHASPVPAPSSDLIVAPPAPDPSSGLIVSTHGPPPPRVSDLIVSTQPAPPPRSSDLIVSTQPAPPPRSSDLIVSTQPAPPPRSSDLIVSTESTRPPPPSDLIVSPQAPPLPSESIASPQVSSYASDSRHTSVAISSTWTSPNPQSQHASPRPDDAPFLTPVMESSQTIPDDASTVGSTLSGSQTSSTANESHTLAPTVDTQASSSMNTPLNTDGSITDSYFPPALFQQQQPTQHHSIFSSLTKHNKKAPQIPNDGGALGGSKLRGISSRASLTKMFSSKDKAIKIKMLHDAARRGDRRSIIECLAENRSAINRLEVLDDEVVPKSLLMRAAENGRIDCLELLVQSGAEFALGDRDGRIALHHAIQAGSLPAAKWLAEHFHTDPYSAKNQTQPIDIADDEGFRPLHIAAGTGNVQILDLLIKRGASIHLVDKYGRSALFPAIIGDHLEAVERLLAAGISPSVADSDKHTPLMWAAEANSPKVATLLLDRGADRRAADAHGNTAIHLAARSGALAVIEMLYLSIDDLDVGNTIGERPLHLAAAADQARVVKALLTMGCDARKFTRPPASRRESSKPAAYKEKPASPLHYACANAAYDPAAHLIEQGAQVNAGQEDGASALMLAASVGSAQVCGLLLEHGANVLAQTSTDGWTALHFALVKGDLNTTKLLVQNGAELYALNRKKQTAWQLATKSGDPSKMSEASRWVSRYENLQRRQITRHHQQQQYQQQQGQAAAQQSNQMAQYYAAAPQQPSPPPQPWPTAYGQPQPPAPPMSPPQVPYVAGYVSHSPLPTVRSPVVTGATPTWMHTGMVQPSPPPMTNTGYTVNHGSIYQPPHIVASARTEHGVEPPPAYSPPGTHSVP